MQDDHIVTSYNLNLTLGARRLVWKGYQGFLAMIKDVNHSKQVLKQLLWY